MLLFNYSHIHGTAECIRCQKSFVNKKFFKAETPSWLTVDKEKTFFAPANRNRFSDKSKSA